MGAVMSEKRYRVTYVYQSPGRAGPFKGRDVLAYRPVRGDQIRAPFGLAIVRSAREIKPAPPYAVRE
jgi:hypothetical protein